MRSCVKARGVDVARTAISIAPTRIARRPRAVTGPSRERDPGGQRAEVTRVHVGYERVTELVGPPHDHVEAPVYRPVDLGRARPRLRAGRPRQSVGAKD